MAKQNSATDPISAAMSAIESALNLTDDDALPPPAKAAPIAADRACQTSRGHAGPEAERAFGRSRRRLLRPSCVPSVAD